MELLDYNFKVIYQKGSRNVVSDSLSRIPLSIEELMELDEKNKAINVVLRSEAKENRKL